MRPLLVLLSSGAFSLVGDQDALRTIGRKNPDLVEQNLGHVDVAFYRPTRSHRMQRTHMAATKVPRPSQTGVAVEKLLPVKFTKIKSRQDAL